MRPYLFAFVGSAAALPHPTAFLPVSTQSRRNWVGTASKAEDHLEELKESFEDLRNKAKHLVPDLVEEDEVYDFTEDMLKMATDYVHTKEEVEMEHIVQAHDKVERAVSKEKHLEELYQEVHHDADDADGILFNYDLVEAGEDTEKRREEAVSDISHTLENSIESKRVAAQEEELSAREEEENAKRTLEELHHNEEDLNAALKELHVFKVANKKDEEQPH